MNLKDPLDYTIEELNTLSVDELQLLQREAETKEQLYNTEQLSLKLQINSLYGAMANRWFPLFNESMAQAITGNGRYFIRKLANYIETTLQNMLSSEKPYILSGDTDSCIGTTLIETSNGKIKMEELFNSVSGQTEVRSSDDLIKHVNEKILTPSVSPEFKLQNKRIKYIMKHKVKKKLFKIIAGGNEVVITEDHSVMVSRAGKLIEIKPAEIKQTDKMVVL